MPDTPDQKVSISCPNCHKAYKVKVDWLGKKIKCKNCADSFTVTQSDEDDKDRLIKKLQSQLAKIKNGTSQTAQSIDGLDTLLLRFNSNKNIEYLNTSFAKTFGVKKEDLIGQPLSQLRKVLPQTIYRILEEDQQDNLDQTIKGERGQVYELRKTKNKQHCDVIINDITDEQKFKDYVSKYINPDLIELSEEELQTFRIPERRFMTVSFTDLRGFTAMSETLSPEEVRTTMNDYLESIINAINENHATVDKIVGDEVMALYGAPKYYQDHAFRAIKTACDQIYNLSKLQKAFEQVGKTLPHCGVGINSGDMVVGNMGSSTYQDYTVLGSAVNLAARLCGAAQGSQIIISEATLNAVLENLPDNWSHRESMGDPSTSSSTNKGKKVESIQVLPENLKNKLVSIGPIDQNKKFKCHYQFRYEYSIKVKGVSQPLPIISVHDLRNLKARDDLVLNDKKLSKSSERIFGKYHLLEPIGAGGMGEVWKARDPFGNIFALKMLLAGDAASEQQVARFKREAKIMGKLNHRGLCKIIEIGEIEKTTFIAMEYIEGITLSDLLVHKLKKKTSHKSISNDDGHLSLAQKISDIIKENKIPQPIKRKTNHPLPKEQAIHLMIRCCEALEYAHQHNILHRDIKPANIMLREDGDPVVMDFGLGKIQTSNKNQVEASMSLSVSGEIVGSIEYMSPEQAEASKHVDERADVYSLGAVFYQMLSGKKYFESSGNLLNDIGQLKDYEGSRLKEVSKSTDVDLDIIVFKSLRPNPDERYPNIKSLRLDLQRYQLGEVISAKDVTLWEITQKFISRHKAFVTLSAMFLGILFAASIFFVYNLNVEKEQAKAALAKFEEEKLKRIQSEKENAPIYFDAALERAKFNDMERAQELIEKAISLNSNELNFHIVKGELLMYREKYYDANVLFFELRKANPDNKTLAQLHEISSVLMKSNNDINTHYQLQVHLNQVGRPYLARFVNQDLAREALLNVLKTSYPDIKRFEITDEIVSGIKRFSIIHGLNNQLDLDLSPLKGWKLGHLNFAETTFQNFASVRDLDFTGITMWDIYPEDLEKLKGKQLTSMFIARFHGTLDIENLIDFPLTSLRLAYVKVKDIELLTKLDLERLYLQGISGLTSIEFIRDMTTLKGLHITQQRLLKDISPIFDLELTELLLDRIYFMGFTSQIQAMKSLQTLGTPQSSLMPKSVFWKNTSDQIQQSFRQRIQDKKLK